MKPHGGECYGTLPCLSLAVNEKILGISNGTPARIRTGKNLVSKTSSCTNLHSHRGLKLLAGGAGLEPARPLS